MQLVNIQGTVEDQPLGTLMLYIDYETSVDMRVFK